MKKTVVILISSLLLFSCKNYLDVEQKGDVIPKTTEEFSALLHDLLTNIDYGQQEIIPAAGDILETEAISDNLETCLTIRPEGNFLPTYVGSKLGSTYAFSLEYMTYYAAIRTCNIVLDAIKDDGKQETNDIIGTCHMIKGIVNYELMRRFCDAYNPSATDQLGLPIVDHFDMEAKPARSSLTATIKYIEDQLKTSIKYNVTNRVYLFNSNVAKAYLARLYFWTQNYAEAITYANEILSQYPLLKGEEYREMIRTEVGKKGNILIKTYMYTDVSVAASLNGARKAIQARPVSKRFIDLFTEGKDDIRYDLSFDSQRKTTKSFIGGVRSAEMCLILAESHYHEGTQAEALRYLNMLRGHRISNYVDYTIASLPPINQAEYIKVDAKGNELKPLIAAILSERRKELFMEGDRWFELKRNGKPEFWVPSDGKKYVTQKFMYTFPFYIGDIQENPNLIQNPGYDDMI